MSGNDKYTLEDMQNPEKMKEIFERVRIKTSGSLDEVAELMSSDRDGCAKRGYHRVSQEPKNGDDPMICYDCELWFDKDFAESIDMKYEVEPC